MALLHPSSCLSNTISLQVHPIFFAWGHLSSQLRPALLEDFITFLYQLGQVQIRDRSSGYLNSPPHQKQSGEGAWHDQKAIRPLHRIKEELNVRFQDGLGTGQCRSPSLGGVPWYTRGDWGSPQCTMLFPERGSGCGLDSHPHPQWGLSHVITWEKLLNHLSTTNMAPIQSFLNILSRWTSSKVWVQSLRSMW